MSKIETLKDFEAKHPHPDHVGVLKLYKYMKFNDERPEYLKDLLLKKHLYLAPPSKLNDPFECKPHWSWPKDASSVKAIRDRLKKVARRNGASIKESERFASNALLDKENFSRNIKEIIIRNFRSSRLCSFSTSLDNILLWSHYADSHRGLCIEFNANVLPFAASMKVNYQDEYPVAEYPMPDDARGFSAVLTKARAWEYENEFRLLLVPKAPMQHPNDGESYFLNGNEITAVYLGAEATQVHKEFVLSLMDQGKLAAQRYQAELSESSYTLKFGELNA
jgi:hypothetical protein